MAAINTDDDNMVKLLIDHNADITIHENMMGYTPLMFAVTHSPPTSPKIIKLLLTSGVNIEGKDRFGHTALSDATNDGKSASVAILLQYHADVNTTDAHGSTPLHIAASKGDLSIAQLLLQAGADQKMRDDQHKTAIDYAKKHNDTKMVNLLRHYRR